MVIEQDNEMEKLFPDMELNNTLIPTAIQNFVKTYHINEMFFINSRNEITLTLYKSKANLFWFC
jgi:hypothetical protein